MATNWFYGPFQSASIEEFQQFYNDFYVPNNATLSIAGDLDYAQTEKWVREYFSEIPKGTKDIYRPNVTEPKKTTEIRDVIYDNIQIPAVIQAYNLPQETTLIRMLYLCFLLI